MTDRGIVKKILLNCIVDVNNLDYNYKKQIYNILVNITGRKNSLNTDHIDNAFMYVLSDDSNYMIRYMDSDGKNHLHDYYFDDILFLKEFYDKNECTKESLDELLSRINFVKQREEKHEILNNLYGCNIQI